MSILPEFHEIVQSPHRFARDWKARTGGKILGYLCTNLPEELIEAAGILPVRLLGSNEPENITRQFIFQAGFCSFARDCLAQALQGRYNYLDGVAFAQCCPHAREAYGNLTRELPLTFHYHLASPMYLQNRHTPAYLSAEIAGFKQALEAWTGRSITDPDIAQSVQVYNTNRSLMGQIYSLLKKEVPPLSHAEAAEIALAGMLIDKTSHNHMLEEALNELESRQLPARKGPRLLLLGSVNNDIELLKFIDSLGGQVVMDDYCTGSRYYQNETAGYHAPLTNLAYRLIEKPPCPLKDIPERRRLPHILDLAEKYRAAGVIYTIQRLCDAHGLDYPAVETALQEKGIPVLKLEMDYTVPRGQWRTRIEAFLEMLHV